MRHAASGQSATHVPACCKEPEAWLCRRIVRAGRVHNFPAVWGPRFQPRFWACVHLCGSLDRILGPLWGSRLPVFRFPHGLQNLYLFGGEFEGGRRLKFPACGLNAG